MNLPVEYILLGTGGIVVLISILLGIITWVSVLSASSKIAVLEQEIEKKAKEFDKIKKEHAAVAGQAAPTAPPDSADSLPPRENTEDDTTAGIEIVQNVRQNYPGETPDKEPPVNNMPAIETGPPDDAGAPDPTGPPPETVPGDRNENTVQVDNALPEREKPTVNMARPESQTPDTAAQHDTDRQQNADTPASIETHAAAIPTGPIPDETPADSTPPDRDESSADIPLVPPHAAIEDNGEAKHADYTDAHMLSNGVSPEIQAEEIEIISAQAGNSGNAESVEDDSSDVLDVVEDPPAVPVEEKPVPRSTRIALYSQSKRDADFEHAWEQIKSILPRYSRPRVILDFDEILFLYEKELDLLHKIQEAIQARGGMLYFARYSREIAGMLRQDPRLAPVLHAPSDPEAGAAQS